MLTASTAARSDDGHIVGEDDLAAVNAGGGVRGGLRRPLRRTARLQGGNTEHAVRTLDVGAGGMAVVAPCNAALNAPCFIRFELPLRERGVASLGLLCSVAHCIYSQRESGFVIGLKFAGLTEAARDLLERYLSR